MRNNDWSWKPEEATSLELQSKTGGWAREELESQRHNRKLRAALSNGKNQRKKKPKRESKKVFYNSWRWKKVRFEALKKYGPECMCCKSDYRLVVDHIKPRSKFPELELDIDNLQILCNECNMGKSNDDYTDFRDNHDVVTPSEYAELEHLAEVTNLH